MVLSALASLGIYTLKVLTESNTKIKQRQSKEVSKVPPQYQHESSGTVAVQP